jgi:cytochrome c oxidase assembly factor CtaG
MALTGIGGLVFFIGVIWLIAVSIQTGQTTGAKILWALVNLLCQPIGGIVFYVVKKQGLLPLVIVIIGTIMAAAGRYSMMGSY